MNARRRRQIGGILRLELSKSLFSRRAAPLYLLASLPLLVVGVVVLVATITGGIDADMQGRSAAVAVFAYLFQGMLRFVLYFGCVWSFTNLFRGEVLDRSLHYYFLTPVRREILVTGKFLSAFVATSAVFIAAGSICLATIYGYLGGAATWSEYGVAHLLGYAGVTLLACLGYGAVFLVAGLFFRNPLVPAIVFWIWEGMNFLMPGLLKKLSVIFYLQSMLPVPVADGPFAVLVQPISAWVAVPGLLIFAGVLLAVAGLQIRSMEVSYSED